jgi:hypothetical protein
MARDLSVDVRNALVERLNANTDIQALGAQAFGPEVPSPPPWPFIRVELPIVLPDFDGCSDATRYRINISCFAKGDDERPCSMIAKAVNTSLDGFEAMIVNTPPDAKLQDTLWTGTQYLKDIAEADGYHGIVSIEAKVAG